MACLEILEFPDPRLRIIAKPVSCFDGVLEKLVADMFETMYQAPGIGLAATQVNVHEQLIVMDISEDQSQPLVLVNPVITVLDDTPAEYREGCLSVPGFFDTVSRPSRVRVQAQDLKGEAFELEPDGLLGVCIQHEMDHLNGKLFVDYLSNLKRQRIRKALEKQHRQQTAG